SCAGHEWSFDEFRPWAARIARSLYVIAWDLEGGPMGDAFLAPGVHAQKDPHAVITQLRAFSGFLMFRDFGNWKVDDAIDNLGLLAEDTLELLAAVSDPSPG